MVENPTLLLRWSWCMFYNTLTISLHTGMESNALSKTFVRMNDSKPSKCVFWGSSLMEKVVSISIQKDKKKKKSLNSLEIDTEESKGKTEIRGAEYWECFYCGWKGDNAPCRIELCFTQGRFICVSVKLF